MSQEPHPLARLSERGEPRGADEVLRAARSDAARQHKPVAVLLGAAAVIAIGVVSTLVLVGDDGESPSVQTTDAGPEPAPVVEETTTTDRTASPDAAVMPDLTGATLNELGEETGVLYELHDRIGLQQTHHVPSDQYPEGIVFDQDPPPGTELAAVTEWSLTVSAGGPVVHLDDLPDEVAAFAATLDRLDDDLLVQRTNEFGTVYKSENWVFGLDCEAVDAAYRTFVDGRYDLACPGHIQAP